MTEETKDEELKLRELEDGSVAVGDEPPPKVEEEDDHEDDERIAKNESDEEEGHDEETAEESAARTERNRKRRAESKEKRKSYIDSLKRDLAARDRVINDMSNRLSVVERKSTGSEMAQLDTAEKEALQAYNHFKDINAKAIEQANGQIAIEAQERMFQARQRYENIQSIKKQMGQRQQTPQPLDPRLVNHAQEWMSKNDWYDPSGSNEDSAVALTIDSRMAKEGWDPTTPEYWDELEKRVKKYLPHRANSGYNKSQGSGRRSPPPVAGSGRESSSSGNSSTYKLSPDRVKAIKEAGAWDDPVTRAAMIKSYQNYDKEQRA